jgi:small-conductance mechanosensitive channel
MPASRPTLLLFLLLAIPAYADGGVPDGGTAVAVVETQPVTPGFEVRIGDRRIFVIRADRAGLSADLRARRASQTLEQLSEEGKVEEVRTERNGELMVVYVGRTPVVQLDGSDAKLAHDASLEVHADAVAEAIRRALANEVRRRATANLVFSFSLVVLSGLIAFLLIGAVSRGARRVIAGLQGSTRVSGFRVGNVELLTPAAVKVAVTTAISVGKPILQLALAYFWVVFALSLFPATASLGQKVSGFMLTPLTTLFGRIGATLPVIALFAVGAFALIMLLRFLGVFFDSVANREMRVSWLSAELARPVGVLLRAGVVAAALLAAAPLVTGQDHGTLPLAGTLLLGVVGLAAVPVLSSSAVGIALLLSHRVSVGDFVEIGPVFGRVKRVTLLEVVLTDRAGNELRVPNLLMLVRTLRVIGDMAASRWEITVDPKLPQGRVRKTLADAVARQGHAVYVELVEIDANVCRYLVIGAAVPGEDDLASAIADALNREGLSFGRIKKIEA